MATRNDFDLVSYISNAIQKSETGRVASESGSHVAGIFGKAANAFEKEVRSYVDTVVRACNIDYEVDLRAAAKGLPFTKLTLGNCVAVMEKAFQLRPVCISTAVPSGWKFGSFIDTLKKINKAWVQVKHGDDVAESDLVLQMKSMLTVLGSLESSKP